MITGTIKLCEWRKGLDVTDLKVCGKPTTLGVKIAGDQILPACSECILEQGQFIQPYRVVTLS